MNQPMVCLTVYDLEHQVHQFQVPIGQNLRTALLNNGISPYTEITRRFNCGGNGICATCGVWFEKNEPEPIHWHDWAANRYGYPRLSCQIFIQEDITIRLVPKLIWGSRAKKEA